MNWYQQGDVKITECAIPMGSKRLSHTTLAKGGATGHSHVAYGEEVIVFENNGVLYLSAPTGATVKHREHKPVTVSAGEYEIGIVQEYDHFAEEARDVID